MDEELIPVAGSALIVLITALADSSARIGHATFVVFFKQRRRGGVPSKYKSLRCFTIDTSFFDFIFIIIYVLCLGFGLTLIFFRDKINAHDLRQMRGG